MADDTDGWEKLLNPVVLIALLILVSVFVLIGAAILGWDSVLTAMSRADFARGLITYLFAVVTIGTAVLLTVAALTTGATEEHDRKFQRGKEILSLLLGVFGTIVGFYFGSEIRGASSAAEVASLRLTTPLLNQESVVGGDTVTVTAAVSGGTPPYRYGMALGDESEIKYDQTVGKNGWIVTKLPTPDIKEQKVESVKLGVKDSVGDTLTKSATLVLMPKKSGP
jgi:hypothetical protein